MNLFNHLADYFGRNTRHPKIISYVGMALWLLIFSTTAPPAAATASQNTIFTVNSSADDSDLVPGDGNCHTAFNACTLRAAIQEANAKAGTDTIRFQSGLSSILPASALPEITGRVTIDGISGTGSNCPTETTPADLDVRLSGFVAGTGASGLVFGPGSDLSTVRGLNITLFDDFAISIDRETDFITIECNHIGLPNTDLNGFENAGGIEVLGDFNTIGGTDHADRNVIISNGASVIRIDSTSVSSADSNFVSNNYIGTNRAGTAALGSGSPIGVYINGDNNILGGASANSGNVISGFSDNDAIRINSSGDDNFILRNKIGTDVSGTNAIPNKFAIRNIGDGTTIGGAALDGNIIAHSSILGIFSNGPRVEVSHNIIKNNLNGIEIQSEQDHDILFNEIYENGDGIVISGGTVADIEDNNIYNNSENGILVDFSGGGSHEARSNNIYGNGGDGVSIPSGSIGLYTNSIYDNGDQGIDREADGVTLTNVPTLNSAEHSGRLTGTFPSVSGAGGSFSIEVYLNDACDDQTLDGLPYGEGKTYLTAFSHSASTTQQTEFDVVLPLLTTGEFVTLVATRSGFTYEFSNCREIVPATFVVVTRFGASDDNPGDGYCSGGISDTCGLRTAIEEANARQGDSHYNIEIMDGGFHDLNSTLTASHPVHIDGSVEPGSSCPTENNSAELGVVLTGDFSSGPILNLAAGSDGSIIRGLQFRNANDDAIQVRSGGNKIVCNIIGGDPTWAIPGSIGDDGIHVIGGSGNIIGAIDDYADRNVIYASNGSGVQVDSSANSNTITGNYIGVNEDGDSFANGVGIHILGGAQGNQIGGVNPEMVNIIAASSSDGIRITGAAHFNVIVNNIIGSPANGRAGILVEDSNDIRIGAAPSRQPNGFAQGNTIVGNSSNGVWIIDSNDTEIGENTIGDNGGSGIRLIRADDVVVHNNSVYNNSGSGIYANDSVDNATIETNELGDSGLGGNRFDGIHLENTVVGAVIKENTITANDRNGIRVDADSAKNTFDANAIYANGEIGIDLNENEVTLNDEPEDLDKDTGANGLQNFPVINIADALTGEVSGSLFSAKSAQFTLQIFVGEQCDTFSESHGEGQKFIDSFVGTTNEAGQLDFVVNYFDKFDAGDILTMTATGADGTSEFSACKTAAGVVSAVEFGSVSAETNPNLVGWLATLYSVLISLSIALVRRNKPVVNRIIPRS